MRGLLQPRRLCAEGASRGLAEIWLEQVSSLSSIGQGLRCAGFAWSGSEAWLRSDRNQYSPDQVRVKGGGVLGLHRVGLRPG